MMRIAMPGAACSEYTPTDNQDYLLIIHGGKSDSTHNNSQHRGFIQSGATGNG